MTRKKIEQKKRKWQSGEVLKLEGMNPLNGEERSYQFYELTQKYGSELFHKYVLLIVTQWGRVQDILSSELAENLKNKKITEQVSTIAEVLPELLSWDNIQELAEMLLSNHIVECEGEKYTAGNDGFSAMNDPLEIYLAIFFAMCANWPKYFAPLLQTVLKDSTPDSEPEQS